MIVVYVNFHFTGIFLLIFVERATLDNVSFRFHCVLPDLTEQ